MILAKGKIAKKPYELSYLGQNIYSIEELCYVIYHNIYGINEEFFQISLAKWMKEELGLKELAEKLEAMIVGEHGLKDLVVTTLCGCDYYNEEEIRGIVPICFYRIRGSNRCGDRTDTTGLCIPPMSGDWSSNRLVIHP